MPKLKIRTKTSGLKVVSFILVKGVAVHKYVISFCVGLELFSGKINDYWVNFWYIVVYAAMTPLGIGIGIGVTQEASPTLTGVIKKFCL